LWAFKSGEIFTGFIKGQNLRIFTFTHPSQLDVYKPCMTTLYSEGDEKMTEDPHYSWEDVYRLLSCSIEYDS
jgi:hypothetical protein